MAEDSHVANKGATDERKGDDTSESRHEAGSRLLPSCRGLIVSEISTDIGTVKWDCLTCADRVDQVILVHRQHPEVRQEGDEVFAG